MNRPAVTLAVTLGAFLALGAIGCQRVFEKGKAKPLPNSEFLKDAGDMEERNTRFPFQRYWCRGDVMKKYIQIKVAPVNTDYILEMHWWRKVHPMKRGDVEKDREELAVYMRRAFEKAVQKDPKQRFELVEWEGPEMEILELALVEVVPSKAFLNMAAKAGGFFVPGAGAAAMLGRASVAMEGRVRDGATGEIVCKFADREEAKSSPVHLQDYTWYGNVHGIINEWSKQWIEINNSPDPVHDVKDSMPFTLSPW